MNVCIKCGTCCTTPCSIVPSDLKLLLDKFHMALGTFFKKYLIALPVLAPDEKSFVLSMAPVILKNAIRDDRYLADKQYIDVVDQHLGQCIFLNNLLCSIHEVKPLGGRRLQCPRMTGDTPVVLKKLELYHSWRDHQNIFDEIFPGYLPIYKEFLAGNKNGIAVNKLFELFNLKQPVDGFTVLRDEK